MVCQPLLFDIWFSRYRKLKILDLALRFRHTGPPWPPRGGDGTDILRESSDFEDFEKIKNFVFLMLFCNQNDLSAKIWVLAKLVDENIFYGRNQKIPYELRIFFSERGLDMFFQCRIIFGRYSAGKNKFGQFCWCMVENFFFSKNRFFSIFPKVL